MQCNNACKFPRPFYTQQYWSSIFNTIWKQNSDLGSKWESHYPEKIPCFSVSAKRATNLCLNELRKAPEHTVVYLLSQKFQDEWPSRKRSAHAVWHLDSSDSAREVSLQNRVISFWSVRDSALKAKRIFTHILRGSCQSWQLYETGTCNLPLVARSWFYAPHVVRAFWFSHPIYGLIITDISVKGHNKSWSLHPKC